MFTADGVHRVVGAVGAGLQGGGGRIQLMVSHCVCRFICVCERKECVCALHIFL